MERWNCTSCRLFPSKTTSHPLWFTTPSITFPFSLHGDPVAAYRGLNRCTERAAPTALPRRAFTGRRQHTYCHTITEGALYASLERSPLCVCIKKPGIGLSRCTNDVMLVASVVG